MTDTEANGRRALRLGQVGGGPGAFIGAVHRMAARLDGDFELVAGAFSADPERSCEASDRGASTTRGKRWRGARPN